jgi:hypothetical protein
MVAFRPSVVELLRADKHRAKMSAFPVDQRCIPILLLDSCLVRSRVGGFATGKDVLVANELMDSASLLITKHCASCI